MKLGFMSAFVKASANALAEVPAVNGGGCKTFFTVAVSHELSVQAVVGDAYSTCRKAYTSAHPLHLISHPCCDHPCRDSFVRLRCADHTSVQTLQPQPLEHALVHV